MCFSRTESNIKSTGRLGFDFIAASSSPRDSPVNQTTSGFIPVEIISCGPNLVLISKSMTCSTTSNLFSSGHVVIGHLY